MWLSVLLVMAGITAAYGQSTGFTENIYPVGKLKPTDSVLKVKVGDVAPDFTLPAVEGGTVSLSQYKGRKNVVISFVPAAWTPVCSDQWPGYNISKKLFDKYDATLIGITVDNIPTLYAWTKQMCNPGEKLWFPVLSDFYPHGAVASQYRRAPLRWCIRESPLRHQQEGHHYLYRRPRYQSTAVPRRARKGP